MKFGLLSELGIAILFHYLEFFMPIEGKSIYEYYENARELQEIDLSNKGLTAVPEQTEELKKLRELDLSENKIKLLPKEIGRLNKLEKLDLHKNDTLTLLPEEIGGDIIRSLKSLNLSYTGLRSIPALDIWWSLWNTRNFGFSSHGNFSPAGVEINLQNTNLLEYGEGDSLGWRELMEIFGDKVLHSD